MGFMRTNHINKRTTIIRPGQDAGSGPNGDPDQSLVNMGGVMQKVVDSGGGDDGYTIRMQRSSNPIVTTDAQNAYSGAIMSSQPAYGHHFDLTVARSRDRDVDDPQQWVDMLVAAQYMVESLYAKSRVGYVAVFADMDASSRTPNLQIATFADVPAMITDEIRAFAKARQNLGMCHMCHTTREKDGKSRHILETKHFVAFCPWSPSFPYEFWISPKKHSTSFVSASQKELKDLALILQASLGGLTRILKGAPYSLAFHLSPERKNNWQMHWHIEVYADAPVSLGLCHGFGISLCDVTPEEAAARLGEAGRNELVAIVGV